MGVWRRVYDLVAQHKAARPEMRARDAYKLLYQGVFGVGHIMGPGAWDYLQGEAKAVSLEDQPREPLMEPVSLAGAVVRVNLRPYIREGYPLHALMEAMRHSDIEGNPAEFLDIWDTYAELVWNGQLDFEHNEVDAVSKALDRAKPQPMHHTQQYRDAYRPAYRVVRRREVLKILGI